MLFGLKKRSSGPRISPSPGKFIVVHHELTRVVVRAPTAKTFTSTKLAFYHFVNMMWARVCFPRAPPYCTAIDTTVEDSFCVGLQFRQEAKHSKCFILKRLRFDVKALVPLFVMEGTKTYFLLLVQQNLLYRNLS